MNYEKLTLEGCKELAKNRRIPPGVAVQALASQQAKLQIKTHTSPRDRPDPSETPRLTYNARHEPTAPDEDVDEKEELRLNLYKMQNRVMELEKVCREMKGQMSKMVKSKSFNYRSCLHSSSSKGMPRLCWGLFIRFIICIPLFNYLIFYFSVCLKHTGKFKVISFVVFTFNHLLLSHQSFWLTVKI